MSRRYDSRTTIFSPEGRLYQVEYAMEALNHTGAALGVVTTEGIVLAAEKKTISKLLDADRGSEKMYQIDAHVACVVAGIFADSNILMNYARLSAQRYEYSYQQPMPVEQLIQQICDLKQGYTQYGGLRPFGVSFLYAGWDKQHGFQLYQSDPSGNYGGWKATAIGANNQSATSLLKQEWNDEMKLEDGLQMALKIMSKTVDSTTLNSEKLEFATLTRPAGKVEFHIWDDKEIQSLIDRTELEKPSDE